MWLTGLSNRDLSEFFSLHLSLPLHLSRWVTHLIQTLNKQPYWFLMMPTSRRTSLLWGLREGWQFFNEHKKSFIIFLELHIKQYTQPALFMKWVSRSGIKGASTWGWRMLWEMSLLSKKKGRNYIRAQSSWCSDLVLSRSQDVESGPPGWKPGILTSRPYGTLGPLIQRVIKWNKCCFSLCFSNSFRPYSIQVVSCKALWWGRRAPHFENRYSYENWFRPSVESNLSFHPRSVL